MEPNPKPTFRKRINEHHPSMTAGKPIEIGLYVYVEGQGMYCTVCQKANKRPFDRDTWNKTPATRMQLETIKSHKSCNRPQERCSPGG